ncbi:hypothetical protein K435DRAFT_654829, partial [Dendrothele bispora CBS 962.96]
SPHVEFCGYSVPSPSEPNIQLCIQMFDEHSSLEALSKALGDLDDLCLAVNDEYEESLWTGEFERRVEKSRVYKG